MIKERKVVCVLLLCMAVSGCDTIKEKVGLTRHAPDEFAVMQRAPLEMPSDFTTLPKPVLGAPRPQEVAAKDQAKQLILGGPVVAKETESAGEDALLKQVGAGQANTNIRAQLDKEADETDNSKVPVVKRWLGLDKDEPKGKVVDPVAEAKRIQDAKKAGKPVTTGATPSLED